MDGSASIRTGNSRSETERDHGPTSGRPATARRKLDQARSGPAFIPAMRSRHSIAADHGQAVGVGTDAVGRWLPWLWAALLVAFEVWRSWLVIPLPDGDQLLFYPVYLAQAQGRGLVHPFWTPFEATDGGPMVWHGWLQPWLLGHAGGLLGGGIQAALLAETAVIALTLGAYQLATRDVPPRAVLLRLLYSLFVLGALSAGRGRPELLATFFLIVWVWGHMRLRGQAAQTGLAALILGLLGATQPTIAALSSLFYLNALLVRSEAKRSLYLWLLANAGAALVLVVLTGLVYPYPIVSWLRGLLAHGDLITSRSDVTGLIYYLFYNPYQRFMHGLVIIYGLLAFFLRYRSSLNLWSVLAGSITLFMVWYFGLRIPPTSYNILIFAPVIVLLDQMGTFRYRDAPGQHAWQAARNGLVALLAAGSLVPYAVTAQSAYVGLSRDAFGAHLAAFRERHAEVVVPRSFIVGAVPLASWGQVTPGPAVPSCRRAGAVVVVQQANTGRIEPPAISGAELIADHFYQGQPGLPGVPFPRLTPKAYNFAAYRCS